MSESILHRLQRGERLVSDGAMGTQLQQRGLPAGHCPEEFNVSHPEVVVSIYRDYYEAGSDIVTTNTFGGNAARLKAHGYEQRVAEFSRKSAELLKSVCPAGRFAAACVGPTGEMLEPAGTAQAEDLYAMYAEQARALLEGGVDLFFVETMMAVDEAEVAVRALKDATALPVSATMTFQKVKTGYRTMWGVSIAEAVSRLSEAGADILGANCGQGFEQMIEIVREMRCLTDKPILAQSNAGLPEWVDGQPVYRETPAEIIPFVEKLVESGLNIIGGCCGTGPEHIRAIRKLVDRASSPMGSDQ
jgi:5-methyltetrahydrofolate--homocysteine methyltransferase